MDYKGGGVVYGEHGRSAVYAGVSEENPNLTHRITCPSNHFKPRVEIFRDTAEGRQLTPT